jgi:hypothetical protein
MASGRRRRPDRIARSGLLSTAVAQGEGERLGEVFGPGGFQLDDAHEKPRASRGRARGQCAGLLEVNGIPVRAVLSMLRPD